jgi:hypothetical protein
MLRGPTRTAASASAHANGKHRTETVGGHAARSHGEGLALAGPIARSREM